MKYDELKFTNRDIIMQKQMIKDDKDLSPGDAGDVSKVDKGMVPPVKPGTIDPSDLLDPNKAPDDLPTPKDKVHADQIAAFFNSDSNRPKESNKIISYDDILGGS
jgi:hypothetical protein